LSVLVPSFALLAAAASAQEFHSLIPQPPATNAANPPPPTLLNLSSAIAVPLSVASIVLGLYNSNMFAYPPGVDPSISTFLIISQLCH
jgi:hypothetical protein